MAQYLRENQGLDAVELGFGVPGQIQLFGSLCRSYTLVDVVDRREGMDCPDTVRFQKADLDQDFPFEDGTFDVMIAMMIIEHLYDPFHSFAEVARVTKPGGRIFVNLPNIASIKCRLQLLQGKMPVTSSPNWFEKRCWDGNHLHYFTVADTKRLAEHCGLKLVALHPVGKNLALKTAMPELFCHEISFEFVHA